MINLTLRLSILGVILCGLWCPGILSAQLLTEGDFHAAYSFSSVGQARGHAPSPTGLAGVAAFQYYAAPRFLVGGSAQTFTSSHVPGSDRTTGYGVTKIELNGILLDRA